LPFHSLRNLLLTQDEADELTAHLERHAAEAQEAARSTPAKESVPAGR
jgi:hypothetical protein